MAKILRDGVGLTVYDVLLSSEAHKVREKFKSYIVLLVLSIRRLNIFNQMGLKSAKRITIWSFYPCATSRFTMQWWKWSKRLVFFLFHGVKHISQSWICAVALQLTPMYFDTLPHDALRLIVDRALAGVVSPKDVCALLTIRSEICFHFKYVQLMEN